MHWQGIDQKNPGGVSGGIAAFACAKTIGKGVAHNNARGTQGDEDLAPAITTAHVVCAQTQNTRAERQHAAPGPHRHVYAKGKQGQRGEQGRAAAHDRIGKAHVHPLIGGRNAEIVAKVAQARHAKIGPGSLWQRGQKRQQTQCTQASAKSIQACFKKLVVSAFDNDVPQCVQKRGKQYGYQDGWRHSYYYDYSCAMPRHSAQAPNNADTAYHPGTTGKSCVFMVAGQLFSCP